MWAAIAHNRAMDVLHAVVRTLIDQDSTSCKVRDGLTAYMSLNSEVSHRQVNRLLTEMVDAGILYRVQMGGRQYYAYDFNKPLRDICK